MPVTLIRTLEKNLVYKLKDFFLTMQEFFLFGVRAFLTIPKIRRYWRDFLDQAKICGADSIPIVLVSAIQSARFLPLR